MCWSGAEANCKRTEGSPEKKERMGDLKLRG